jgi:polysaccharide biosynthesis transport protein
MNVSQFMRILAARWRVPVFATLIGVILSLAWVLFGPSRYNAVAQVLVDVRTPVTVAINGDPGVTPQLQPDYLATQVDVIQSNTVALAAVDALGLVRNPDAMDIYRDSGSKDDARTFFANRLLKDLRVTPSESSRVISIAFTEPDAQLAALYANAFAEAYRSVSIDLQRQPAQQATENYRANVANLAHQLSDAQAQLSDRRAALGIIPNADGSEAEDAKLVALSQQLAAAQATQATMNQRGAGGALPDVINSPVVQSLQVEIAKLDAQRQQLATVAGPNNVDYKQVMGQLATLRAQLAQQRALVANSAANTSGQASAAVRQLSGAVSAQRQKTMANQKARGELLALQENVDNLKSTYEALTARQAQNALLSTSNISNVTILAHADAPDKQAGLPRPALVILSAIVGLILGLGLAILSELLDHRLRVADDIPTWLGVPSLGGVRQPVLAGRRPLLLGATMRYLPGR